MANKEKFERLALVLAILKKLDLTPEDLLMYHNALDVIRRAQDEGENPPVLAYHLRYDQCVIDLITDILKTKGELV